MAQIVKVYALMLGSALLLFASGLQGLLMSIRGAEEGFSLYSLGLLGTSWSVGFVAGSVSVPMLVGRVGHIRTYAVMAVVGGLTILLNLLWINDTGWIATRALSGFSYAGAAMVVESWLNEVSENRTRGTIFALYVTINTAASTLGQMSMSLTGTMTYIPFVLGAMAYMGAILPTALSSSPQPQPLTSGKIELGLLLKTSPIAAVAAFFMGVAGGAFGTLAPVYGYALHLSSASIALIVAVAALAGAVSQVPFGRLSDVIDRRLVLAASSLGAALIGIMLVLLNPGDGWLLYILFGLYGLFAYPLYAIAVAHANDFAKEGEFAKIAAAILLMNGIGLAIGPLLASWAMNAISPVAMFIVTASSHGLIAAFALVRTRMRDPLPAEERAPFQPVPLARHSTPETFSLDPRSEDDTSDPEEDVDSENTEPTGS